MTDLKNITILLVEDNLGHSRLIQKNLKRSGLTNHVVVVSDGRQALDYLFSEGEYASTKRASPLLVLLDLNMPVMDGYQVLKHMKGNDDTKYIPVVVLTTTDDPREIEQCYKLGCNVYITKPVDYTKFSEAIRKLGLFISVVTIPNGLN